VLGEGRHLLRRHIYESQVRYIKKWADKAMRREKKGRRRMERGD